MLLLLMPLAMRHSVTVETERMKEYNSIKPCTTADTGK